MIEFHRQMLADRVRNDAFAEALTRAVRPGMVVADIGAGTGFLGFLASKLGAKECHLYEVGDVLQLAKQLAAQNGIMNCRFIHKHSAEVKNPPKADVVISETLGNYALEENILETLRDARRFLKPGGVMIPQRLRQFVCPLVSDRLYREITAWDRVGHGLDFTAARAASINNIYVRHIDPTELLPGGAKEWDALDFREENTSIRTATVEWTPMSAATIAGFAVWWECDLLDGLTLSTAPHKPATHWEQIYLPVPELLAVKAGEPIRLRLRSDSRFDVKIRIQWEAEAGGHTHAMDMWKGMV